MVLPLLLACITAPSVPTAPVVAEATFCDDLPSCTTACDAGEALACDALGARLEATGDTQDPEAASERYRQACDLGAGIGCLHLALQKSGGRGIPGDLAEAAALLVRAHTAHEASCRAGVLLWCTERARMIRRGEGVPRDPAMALGLYREACAAGATPACLEQATMLFDGEAGPVDAATAEALLHGACGQGTALACRQLALRTNDLVAARLLLIRGCEAPVPDGLACAMAGDLTAATPGTEAEAAPLFRKACEGGIGPACLEVVRLASLGYGALTPEQARPWVERACALGDARGCAVLDSVRSGGGPP